MARTEPTLLSAVNWNGAFRSAFLSANSILAWSFNGPRIATLSRMGKQWCLDPPRSVNDAESGLNWRKRIEQCIVSSSGIYVTGHNRPLTRLNAHLASSFILGSKKGRGSVRSLCLFEGRRLFMATTSVRADEAEDLVLCTLEGKEVSRLRDEYCDSLARIVGSNLAIGCLSTSGGTDLSIYRVGLKRGIEKAATVLSVDGIYRRIQISPNGRFLCLMGGIPLRRIRVLEIPSFREVYSASFSPMYSTRERAKVEAAFAALQSSTRGKSSRRRVRKGELCLENRDFLPLLGDYKGEGSEAISSAYLEDELPIIQEVAFLGDGSYMVHGEQNKLKCISLVSGDIIFEVSAGERDICSVSRSASGRYLASCSLGKGIDIWSLSSSIAELRCKGRLQRETGFEEQLEFYSVEELESDYGPVFDPERIVLK